MPVSISRAISSKIGQLRADLRQGYVDPFRKVLSPKGIIKTAQSVNEAFIRPLRLRHFDGGTVLAVTLQGFLRPTRQVIRIDKNGDVTIDGQNLFASYGTRHLGEAMMASNHHKRAIAIVTDSSFSGNKLQQFVAGLNTGNLEAVGYLKGCTTVFITDYELLPKLKAAGVRVIKVNPELDLNDQELLEIDMFLKRNPPLMDAFEHFTSWQRTTLLSLLKRKLLSNWEELSASDRNALLSDLFLIDADQIATNIKNHLPYILSSGADKTTNRAQIKGKIDLPVMEEIVELSKLPVEQLSEFAQKGQAHIEAGKLGVVVMAAGAATRFGRGPKALINVDNKRTFLQIAAEDVAAASQKSGKEIPLFVMVNPFNGDLIIKHFEDNNYFGLKEGQVHFFYQDAVSPKIKSQTTIARSQKNTRVEFAPTGHGFVITGIQRDVAPICEKLGVETLVIKNIDNLGSTVRDVSYAEVLGNHLDSGRGATVELVWPKTEFDPETQQVKLLDQGGGAMSVNGKNCLVESFAVPEDLQAETAANPFNTLTITVQVEDIKGINTRELPWYVTHKTAAVSKFAVRTLFQFEQLLGDLTHKIHSHFVIVDREGEKGRFIPVKQPSELGTASELFKKISLAKDKT